METLYTVDQAANLLHVTARTVREWLRTKKLKGVLAGRFWRIKESDLQAFLREPGPTDEDGAAAAVAEGRPEKLAENQPVSGSTAENLAEPGRLPYAQSRQGLARAWEAEFIHLWQAGASAEHLAAALAIPPATVKSRAHTLQREGKIPPRPRGGKRERR